MTDIIGYMLIIIGILFDIFGCIGLVRFPDVYNRLQASTKCVTLGTILLLTYRRTCNCQRRLRFRCAVMGKERR